MFLLAFLSIVAYEAADEIFNSRWFFLQLIALGLTFLAFRSLARKHFTRNKLKKTDFPAEWRNILTSHVEFYNALDDDQKKQFEYEIQCFIAEKRITGIKTQIDDTDKILVAASAVIPIFGFPEWEYTNLQEVLIYPGTFREDFTVEGKANRNVLGMVGSGFMNGMMILSQPDLRNGFMNAEDRMNVGIHEFVHLLDKSDGTVDGLPQQLLDKQYMLPWFDMMMKEMEKIHKGKSDINPYGGVAKEEFFAVASEYFFERPDTLQEKHPQLYNIMSHIFRQDHRKRLARLLKNPFHRRTGELGRNSPCPCGV
ncbi:MAG: zinc-dependent peptidase [Chitinophagaceae bacterium]|nr:MAG: zinc-dependent peptidase [Chitinophagaceae bacterium]